MHIIGIRPINTAEDYLQALLRLDDLQAFAPTPADKAELAALDKIIIEFEAAVLRRGPTSVI